MTDKEIIEKIEQAPKEMQTMVAKAFLREDIPNEDIQYLFNTTPLEEMNEKDVVIENQNAEQPEGIGAVGFTMRTSKPYDNKQYITRGAGGYSNCIKGYPMDSHANVLANCVGYASGRFNELISIARDFDECRYTNLRCNASGFIERAQEASLQIGNEPRVGAIMCWGGGPSGCGHVEAVERVDSKRQLYSSGSDYGGDQFYNALRNNDNGRWGLSSSFYFRGFIYQPEDVQKWIDGTKVTPNVNRDEYTNQIEVKVDTLRVRTYPALDGAIIGCANIGYYNYYEVKNNDGYNWYRIADSQWIASSDEWTKIYPAKPKEPVTPNVEKDEYKDQIEVKVDNLRVRKDTSLNGTVIGYASIGFYNYYETKDADDYTWYRIADNQWVAYNKDWFDVYPAKAKDKYIQFKVLSEKDGYVEIDLGKAFVKNK